MYNQEYKKTYKPFIAWFILFLLFTTVLPMIFNLDTKLSVLMVLLIMVVGLYLLMFILYKGEYVYWINGGPSYEKAKAAGGEKRKEYAKAHLDLFKKMMYVSVIYILISFFMYFPSWIDFLIISIFIIVTAFATMPIKFE